MPPVCLYKMGSLGTGTGTGTGMHAGRWPHEERSGDGSDTAAGHGAPKLACSHAWRCWNGPPQSLRRSPPCPHLYLRHPASRLQTVLSFKPPSLWHLSLQSWEVIPRFLTVLHRLGASCRWSPLPLDHSLWGKPWQEPQGPQVLLPAATW